MHGEFLSSEIEIGPDGTIPVRPPDLRFHRLVGRQALLVDATGMPLQVAFGGRELLADRRFVSSDGYLLEGPTAGLIVSSHLRSSELFAP